MKVITIGRSQDNDIEINDVKVSRNHLQIVQDDNGNYSVVDLGSTNGTFVNGQRTTGEVRLQPNDEVKIGNTTLPWQSYFMSKEQPPEQPPVIEKPKPKRTVWYIAAAAALLLLIGSGIALKVFFDRNQERREAEITAQLQQEAVQREIDARRLQDEADRLWQEAIRLEAEDRDAAEQAREAATAAQSRADAARREAETAADAAREQSRIDNLARAAAEGAAAKAREQSRQDSIARVAAERQRITADSIAAVATSRAEEAERLRRERAERDSIALANAQASERDRIRQLQADANTRERLLNEFHSAIRYFNNDDFEAVCRELRLSTRDTSASDVLIQSFTAADIQGRQRILQVVGTHLNQVVRPRNAETTEQQPDTEDEQ